MIHDIDKNFVKDSDGTNRGFVTIGIDTDTDQIKYNYLLATSIKLSDPNASVCLIVDKDKSGTVPKKYLHIFDYIAELPFGNTGHKDGFHGSNLWQIIHCTPYDETIYVDNDTLFLNVDVDLLWDKCSSYDLAMPSTALTFRNHILDKRQMFNVEENYDLPTLFSNFIYFKRASPLALEWFKMADPVYQNWRDAYKNRFKDIKPLSFDKTVIANLVTSLLDVEHEVSVDLSFFYDLQNTGQRLWSNDIPSNWTDMLNHWVVGTGEVIIETSAITGGIIHYRDDSFATKGLIDEFVEQFDTERNRRKITD